jgi:hypothetical protein
MLRWLVSAMFSEKPSETSQVGARRGLPGATSPPGSPPTTGYGATEGDRGAGAALTLLQGLVDQEISRGERVVGRARGAFGLAAGFFAIAQTVAFGSFAHTLISAAERSTLLWLAGAAGVALCVCGALLLGSERRWRTYHISPEQILAVLDEQPDDGTSPEERFVEYYAGVVDQMRKTNRDRQRIVWWTQAAALVSLAVVLAELLYSFDARLS